MVFLLDKLSYSKNARGSFHVQNQFTAITLGTLTNIVSSHLSQIIDYLVEESCLEDQHKTQ